MKIVYVFLIVLSFSFFLDASRYKSRLPAAKKMDAIWAEFLVEKEKSRREDILVKKILITFGSTMGVLSAIAICDIFKINPLYLLTKVFTKSSL